MKEYDLYVPLRYNDGTAIEPAKFRRIQRELLNRFGGLTFFPQANEGFWTMAGITYRDEIVVYRVLTDKARAARHFFRRFKAELKRDLQQEEILVVERDVTML